jgi:hypothetical protein
MKKYSVTKVGHQKSPFQRPESLVSCLKSLQNALDSSQTPLFGGHRKRFQINKKITSRSAPPKTRKTPQKSPFAGLKILRGGLPPLQPLEMTLKTATKKSHPVKNRNVSRETFSPESKAWPRFFGKMSGSFFAILSLMWALFFTFDRGFGGGNAV